MDCYFAAADPLDGPSYVQGEFIDVSYNSSPDADHYHHQ